MKLKKIKKYALEIINRDKFMRFARDANPSLYQREYDKILQKLLNENKLELKGRIQAKIEMKIIESQQEVKNINDPWLRGQIARERIKKIGAYKNAN